MYAGQVGCSNHAEGQFGLHILSLAVTGNKRGKEIESVFQDGSAAFGIDLFFIWLRWYMVSAEPTLLFIRTIIIEIQTRRRLCATYGHLPGRQCWSIVPQIP